MKDYIYFFFFSSRRRHTRWNCDWSSDVCSSDLPPSTRSPPGQPKATGGLPRSSKNASAAPSWKRSWRRSEERRVGKEGRSRWPPHHKKKKRRGRGSVWIHESVYV